MNLQDEIQKYLDDGFSDVNAVSKVCQDVILYKISKYKMSDNVTVKGGVVMMQLSKDKRRATQDLDIDFIKYPISTDAIKIFIDKMSDDDVKLSIKSITDLRHQDYNGKRIYLDIIDNYNNSLGTKIDLGVHKYMDIEQENMYFDLSIVDESVSLLANSCEQIFVEKVKSLLRFRIASTRYKDIFDFYYLINNTNFDKDKCLLYIEKLIFADDTININNIDDMYKVLKQTLENKRFQGMLNDARNNWLGLPIEDVTNNILDFIGSLETVVQ